MFDIDVQEGAPPLKLPYNVNGASLSGTPHRPGSRADVEADRSREPIRDRAALPREARAPDGLHRPGGGLYLEEYAGGNFRWGRRPVC